MLNELYKLADSLEKSGIKPKEWHNLFKPLPKVTKVKPCFKISISQDAKIDSIDPLDYKHTLCLRKWEPNNGNSFPGFNIYPLYRITDDKKKDKLKKWREGKEELNIELLKSWCSNDVNNWDNNFENKLQKCLRKIPQEITSLLDNDNTDYYASIKLLISRVNQFPNLIKNNQNGKNNYALGFREIIEEYIWRSLKTEKKLKDLLQILIYERGVNKNDNGLNISIFLDIPDWKEFPIASSKTIGWINTALLNSSKTLSTLSSKVDAFGAPICGENEKLPEVKLPIIDKVKLRAMNSASPCQSRYGTISSSSFPIGQQSRKRTKGALEWIGDPSREGETWDKFGKKGLIFAYVKELPEVPIKLATCFGAGKADNEVRFLSVVKDVMGKFKTIRKDIPYEIELFNIEKVDIARTQVGYSRKITVQMLGDAVNDWHQGCINIPKITIKVGNEKCKDEVSPEIPFPLQVADCLNCIWKLDGNKYKTQLIDKTFGIKLLFDEYPSWFILYILKILVKNSSKLFIFLGGRSSKEDNIYIKLIPSILGLLLYKLHIRKENYMNNVPFLIGQMLKNSDQLHLFYCKKVRDKKFPPQFIGNALMITALENPNRAIAELAYRLKPYYAWVQKVYENEGPAKQIIDIYENIVSKLENSEIPSKFNDAEQAQFLLGYLAKVEK